jgi:hypothetical protein
LVDKINSHVPEVVVRLDEVISVITTFAVSTWGCISEGDGVAISVATGIKDNPTVGTQSFIIRGADGQDDIF